MSEYFIKVDNADICAYIEFMTDEERINGGTNAVPTDVERFYELRSAANECFDVESFHLVQGVIKIGIREEFLSRNEIKKIFSELGYRAYIYNGGARKFCTLVSKNGDKGREQKKEILKAWGLFIATLISTTVVGYYHSVEAQEAGVVGNAYLGALSFSFTLLLILGAHELAHKWAASRNGVDSSPPYFLPFPSLIGTLGAVIRVKSPIPDANASVALGASGPIAGFIFTVPALIIGIVLSKPVHYIPRDAETLFGTTILWHIIYSIFGSEIFTGYKLYYHPVAIAAWAGMLVTGLNLIPIGQLDGGHILHALMGEKIHDWVSRILIGVMFAVGIPGMMAMFGLMGGLNKYAYDRFWPGWLIWAFLGVFIIKRKYPGYVNRRETISLHSWIIGIIALVIFALSFMPIPIRVYEVIGGAI